MTTAGANAQSEFALRLQEAMKHADIESSPSVLSRLFNQHSKSKKVTTHGARKWLLGESIPTQERLLLLSELLAVSPSWLRFGSGKMINGTSNEGTDQASKEDHEVMYAYKSLPYSERNVVRSLLQMLKKRARK